MAGGGGGGGDGDVRVLEDLEKSTANAKLLQRETLRAILQRNARVGYLRRFLPVDGFDGTADADAFRRLVPISSYDDYAPLIQQIADGGDPSALSFDALLCFFYSSGTSSMKPKMIPYFDSKTGKAASLLAHQASSAILERDVPSSCKQKKKILWFLHAGDVRRSKGGYPLTAATTFSFHGKGDDGKASAASSLLEVCSSPAPVFLRCNLQQQIYCHLLCGLRLFRSIHAIRAPYAGGLARAFRLLRSKWPQLCDDIRLGSLSSDVTDPPVRAAVENLLSGPQPEIAERVHSICCDPNWSGLLPRLWPEATYLACVATGSMEQYFPYLKYLAGEQLPLLGGDYFTSECCVGINMNRSLPPNETRYVLLPTAAYFEFLPFEVGRVAVDSEAVDIGGVELGSLYEVVATTHRGLYRYRLGDVVKVVGFHNESPEVAFVGRSSGEAFTERELASAVEELVRIAELEVVEYACFVEEEEPRRVVVFLELGGGGASREEVGRWCHVVESCLGGSYRVSRARGEYGPLVMAVVGKGAFQEVLRVGLENGAPANQYKCPKILTNNKLVHVLNHNRLFTVSSSPPDL